MVDEIIILYGTAASIGFFYTLFGPHHYLPFIALAKAQQWSSIKTFVVPLLCGIAHVVGSVILGFAGILLGIDVCELEIIELCRANLAMWVLLAFGFTYFIWGIHRMIRNKPYGHLHMHENGKAHTYPHIHFGEHSHIHESKSVGLTLCLLFIIFTLDPCELLISILMYPAAEDSMISVVIVATIFGVVTILTMLCIVLASFYGLSKVSLRRVERYSHALAGLVILLCGVAKSIFSSLIQ